MKIVISQRIIRSISYWMVGLLTLGAVLDTIVNSITLITRKKSIIGTIVITLFWIVAEILIKYGWVEWAAEDKKHLPVKKLGIGPRLSILAMISVLWIPIFVHIPKSDTTTEKTITGSEVDDRISHLLTPIKDVKVSFQVEFQLTDARLASYRRRLDEGCLLAAKDFEDLRLRGASEEVNIDLEKFNMAHNRSIGIGTTCPDISGVYHPCTYILGSDSIYAPNKEDEELAYNVIKGIYIDFTLYKNPIPVDSFKDWSNRPKPDLNFATVVTPETKLFYRYNVNNNMLLIDGEYADSVSLKISDNIYSVKDMAGAQLFVTLNPMNLTDNPSIYKETEEIRNLMHMHHFTFKIDNQEIEMPQKTEGSFKTNRGNPANIATMPTK